jgi:hypothetical protein
MGTVPFNFPPESTMDIAGAIITGVSLGNTGPLADTVFFTAPVRGLFQIAGVLHVTQTDGAGTLAWTIETPPVKNPLISTGPVTLDIGLPPRLVLLEKGGQIKCNVTTTGVVATKYNVYVSVTRNF